MTNKLSKNTRRKCIVCSKVLGSTRERCHDCGGESFRGERRGSNFSPSAGVAHWFRRLIDDTKRNIPVGEDDDGS